MPRLKLTKTVVDSAQPEKEPLRTARRSDTGLPAQSHTEWPQGLHGGPCRQQRSASQASHRPLCEITVEQARAIAQDW